MKEPETIFQFLTNVSKFLDQNAFTSSLKVDCNHDVEDLDDFYHDACNAPGGLIADMQNVRAEIVWTLTDHYETHGLKAELKKLKKLEAKYKI